MIVRIVLLAAAAIGGGALFGRRAVDRQVERQLPAEIAAAQATAIAELNKQLRQVIAERLIAFGISLAVKAGLIGGVYLLFLNGHIAESGLHILAGFLIAVFLFRDAAKTLPFILPAWRIVRANHWNPRRAFKEFIAGIAFERAYAEAMVAMETGPNRVWLAFSKYSAHSISSDVASAVADVARQTSFERVKWRAVLAACLASLMFGIYVAFILLVLGP